MVVCAIDVANLQTDSRRQEIQLIPQDANGRIDGVDGRSWLMDAEALIANAQLSKTDFPIDYNHASLDARKTGAAAPAAGWVDHTSLQARADGIYGTVEWNAPAVNHLVEREFRYTSPVFTFDPATKKTLAYKGSGLTHYPNLGNLKPVVNAQAANSKENDMDEIIEEIREALNLPTASNAAEIKTELDKLFARAGSLAANSDVSLVDQLSLIEARITTAETKASETVAANSSAPDPGAFVPRAEFDNISTQLKTLTDAAENSRVEAAVNAALESGKITPASLDWAKDYCRKDADGFASFVASNAQVIPMGEDKHASTGASTALSDEETAVCAQLGISVDEFIKTKNEESE